jgi:transcriptional regulator with XRE-family HTH domain
VDQGSDSFPGWAAAQAAEIGRRVAQRRKIMKLSAEALAERCGILGMPSFTRQVIMRLEHSRRESVSVSELSVLAAALEISPVLLIYPLGQADETEYLPGHQASPFDAARWWGGEIAVNAKGDMWPGERRPVTELFRDHHQMLQSMPSDFTKAAYIRARRGLGGTATQQDRDSMNAVTTLKVIRDFIREAGLQPPQLPVGLAWIDEPEV